MTVQTKWANGDVVVVGSGFASTFFLLRALPLLPPSARVIVLERGYRDEHRWQLQNNSNSRIGSGETFRSTGKRWRFTLGFGGGSNCWWACTPRLLPSDFSTRSLFGFGRDWPLSYEDLVPYYDAVETVMMVAGDAETSPSPRTGPFPLRAHDITDPDRLIAAAYPGFFTPQPCARPSIAVGNRPKCCATGTCGLCPIDSKFTIQNSLQSVYNDPRVDLRFGTEVLEVTTTGGAIAGCWYRTAEGEPEFVGGDLVCLGANSLFNSVILLRSGLDRGIAHAGLREQVGVTARLYLNGVDNFQGSSSISGHVYTAYLGFTQRDQMSAALIETMNIPIVRIEQGRWRQLLDVKVIFENDDDAESTIHLVDDFPIIDYRRHSSRTLVALSKVEEYLAPILGALPVEKLVVNGEVPTEAHLMCSHPMGSTEDGVVDHALRHHDHSSLLVLGAGSFPTCPPANPTLTLSALSLRSADQVLR